jgi:hypothetical protein
MAPDWRLAVERHTYFGAAGDRWHAHGGQPLPVISDELGGSAQLAAEVAHGVILAGRRPTQWRSTTF